MFDLFVELTRRVGFSVEWEAVEKDLFLRTLTEELLQPGRGVMDALVGRYVRDGVLLAALTERRLGWKFGRG